jgi:hypothetical protein
MGRGGMNLTVKIMKAEDGLLDLRVVELPDLDLSARTFGEIPALVSEAAARLTGRSEQEFDVEVGY